MPPPAEEDLLNRVLTSSSKPQEILERIFGLYRDGNFAGMPYLHWDELRHRTPPNDLTSEQWWLALKLARRGVYRNLPLVDIHNGGFVYALPDEVLKETEYVAKYTSGQIVLSEEVADPVTRDRYLVSQLIEEAITSSQLEGASTSRRVAREMIRSGRRPRDRSEQMILNNYHAMQRVGELRREKLSIDLICEIHRIVTEGTLDNPAAAGRFEQPGEVRVAVWDEVGELLHAPPPAEDLPGRIQKVCDFANNELQSSYLPGVLKALVVHFMIGYEHPFEDGNGRTARALFYWSMLNQDYWLTEFLSVSRILKRASVKYARSFLFTETDGNDLTYFFSYQLKVLHTAIDDLREYLTHKMSEVREVRYTLDKAADNFNQRQLALLQHALGSPTMSYTVQSHKMSHRVSTETARADLTGLESYGLLRKRKSGKRFVFEPIPDLAAHLDALACEPGGRQPLGGPDTR